MDPGKVIAMNVFLNIYIICQFFIIRSYWDLRPEIFILFELCK